MQFGRIWAVVGVPHLEPLAYPRALGNGAASAFQDTSPDVLLCLQRLWYNSCDKNPTGCIAPGIVNSHPGAHWFYSLPPRIPGTPAAGLLASMANRALASGGRSGRAVRCFVEGCAGGVFSARHEGHLSALLRKGPTSLSGGVRSPLFEPRRLGR